MSQRKIVIVTGLSGSGKSTVARTLEDLGYFCVDNLPVDLAPKLIELMDTGGTELQKIALTIDLRQRKFFPRYSEILDSLKLRDTSLEILFLDARDEVLIRRYSETRRQHPLAIDGSIIDGIKKERYELKEIKDRAYRIIDTSDISVHELRDDIKKIYADVSAGELQIQINAFSFGKGIPLESDLVLDVRFLPNPFFVDKLRDKDGRDSKVSEWILAKPLTGDFLEKIFDLLNFLLPLYIKEGKQYLTVSVGCTGGRHRSVVIASELANKLLALGYRNVRLKFRELGVESRVKSDLS
ncbi:MAG: RNase adapter RapZ [Desulfomonilaceae bacterium]